MNQVAELSQQVEQKQRRSAADVIGELDQEAPKFSGLVLAVCFVGKAKLISAMDNHREMKLQTALVEGGDPIGMIGYTIERKRLRFYSRLIPEYVDQAWASDLLECLMMKFMNSVSESVGSNDSEAEAAWLN
jgi:hypothetical protein